MFAEELSPLSQLLKSGRTGVNSVDLSQYTAQQVSHAVLKYCMLQGPRRAPRTACTRGIRRECAEVKHANLSYR